MVNRILVGDCILGMKSLKDNSVDSIVTDPPYELGFMNKKWDNTGIAYNVAMWKEALRVLKPGGFLLSFGGTRTYHRMTCAIEDAGFEIRDCIQWIYGSGFPKSLNIGKQIDKDNGKGVNLINFTKWFDNIRKEKELSYKQIDEYLGLESGGATANHYCGWKTKQPRFPRLKLYHKLKEWLNFGNEWDKIIEAAEREVTGKGVSQPVKGWQPNGEDKSERFNPNITTPATKEAKKWEGWGTALKPANEPVVVARKPLSEKNVALNVLKWGTAGINIDACRIGFDRIQKSASKGIPFGKDKYKLGTGREYQNQGRFPANIILDEYTGTLLDEQTGELKSGGGIKNPIGGALTWKKSSNHQDSGYQSPSKGGASRFFYCAKASKRERNAGCEDLPIVKGGSMTGKEYRDNKPTNHPIRANHHPTVKPLKLMQYLVRLVTPVGGVVLDPFLGSGTTAIAAKSQGFKYIGIEREEEYVKIAEARIAAVSSEVQTKLKDGKRI